MNVVRWLPAAGVILLLIDLTAETFLAGSPVRWWIAGLVGLYLATVTVTVLRFQQWRSRVTAASLAWTAFSLLAAIVLGASLLGYDSGTGPRALGLDFSQLRLMFVIGCVGVAFFLAAVSAGNRKIQITIAAAGFFFVGGSAALVLLRSVQGPVWPAGELSEQLLLTQMFITVSTLMLLVGLIATLLQRRRSPLLATRVVAPIQIAGLLLLLSPLLTSPPAGQPLAQSGFEAVEPLDPTAKDLGAIRDSVASRIEYEPYTGILRGPGGARDSGAGNHLDRSLLLASLLEQEGYVTPPPPGRYFPAGTDPRRGVV